MASIIASRRYSGTAMIAAYACEGLKTRETVDGAISIRHRNSRMFSIVVPLWNKRETVADAVASVLRQSYRQFELVIVDDGSTDRGMEALGGFDDPRIRRMSQANAGPGPARNRGIEAARHDWIAFLDADDLWLPDHLAELDRVRAAYPRAGLIAARYVCGDVHGRYQPPASCESRIETVDFLEQEARCEHAFCTSSAAIPRTSYTRLGGFGPALAGQDREYWVRIALDLPVAVSRRTTIVYRTGTGGISDTVKRHGLGRTPRRVQDLDPSAALLIERYPQIRSPQLRRAVDRCIDGRFRYCVRLSAQVGDVRTLRGVRPLYFRPPPFADRLIIAVAWLPSPLARTVYNLGFKAKAGLRAMRRRVRALGDVPPEPRHDVGEQPA
jgi:glycosyltransferase involved in cell wall biosynthesis